MLDLKQFLYHITCGDFNTPHCFCDITHQCFAGKKLKNLNFSASGIYHMYIQIILRAGTSIYASSGFGPLGPKPCGGNKIIAVELKLVRVVLPVIARLASINTNSAFVLSTMINLIPKLIVCGGSQVKPNIDFA